MSRLLTQEQRDDLLAVLQWVQLDLEIIKDFDGSMEITKELEAAAERLSDHFHLICIDCEKAPSELDSDLCDNCYTRRGERQDERNAS